MYFGQGAHIMKFDTIGSKVLAAGILSFAVAASAAGAGLWVSFAYERNVAEMANTNGILRDAMRGDMVHDALYGDAMSAVLASDPLTAIKTPSEVIADTKEHADTFAKSIADARAAATDPKVVEALAKVQGPLDCQFIRN
jgi:hypothetical protein